MEYKESYRPKAERKGKVKGHQSRDFNFQLLPEGYKFTFRLTEHQVKQLLNQARLPYPGIYYQVGSCACPGVKVEATVVVFPDSPKGAASAEKFRKFLAKK